MRLNGRKNIWKTRKIAVKTIESCLGWEKNMDENIQILIEQAARGDIDAMVMVGDCYNRGLYTEKNDQAAHKYYKMAADRGHLQAKLMVAIEFL